MLSRWLKKLPDPVGIVLPDAPFAERKKNDEPPKKAEDVATHAYEFRKDGIGLFSMPLVEHVRLLDPAVSMANGPESV